MSLNPVKRHREILEERESAPFDVPADQKYRVLTVSGAKSLEETLNLWSTNGWSIANLTSVQISGVDVAYHVVLERSAA